MRHLICLHYPIKGDVHEAIMGNNVPRGHKVGSYSGKFWFVSPWLTSEAAKHWPPTNIKVKISVPTGGAESLAGTWKDPEYSGLELVPGNAVPTYRYSFS